MGSFAIGSYLIGFLAALCLPDATGVDLTSVEGVAQEPIGLVDPVIKQRYSSSS